MRKNKTVFQLERFRNMKHKMTLQGVLVGLLTGIVVGLFRLVIEKAEFLRTNYMLPLIGSGKLWLLIMIVMIIAFFVYIMAKWQPLASGSGIPQVKAELRGQLKQPVYRLLIAKFTGAVLAIGAGLSIGREGPSIQLGALVGKGYARATRRLPVEEKMLLTCGAGAGLAGAFCAPFSGAVFALEELHKNFSVDVLVSTMAACISANFVSAYIFGLDPVFNLSIPSRLPLKQYWILLIMGVLLGLLGNIYNNLMMKALKTYDKLPKPLAIGVAFALAIVVMLFMPQALGGGHSVVGQIAHGEFTLGFGILGNKIGLGILISLIIFFIVKLIFSAISFGSGVAGGIFLPLLVLGAIVGGIFGEAFNQINGSNELYIANFVILGMVGMFSAIVGAPATGVILITEMTGDLQNFFPLVIVGLISYMVADATGTSPIYDLLLDRLMSKDRDKDNKLDEEEIAYQNKLKKRASKKVIIESDVYIGSPADGNKIKELSLPEGSLVISLVRHGKEIIPSGETIIKGGDYLVVLCAEDYQDAVFAKLDELCKTVAFDKRTTPI
ncbi:MAG: ClC family H(+)/Cl(-) exchange transporter [Christensenellales bacterium]